MYLLNSGCYVTSHPPREWRTIKQFGQSYVDIFSKIALRTGVLSVTQEDKNVIWLGWNMPHCQIAFGTHHTYIERRGMGFLRDRTFFRLLLRNIHFLKLYFSQTLIFRTSSMCENLSQSGTNYCFQKYTSNPPNMNYSSYWTVNTWTLCIQKHGDI